MTENTAYKEDCVWYKDEPRPRCGILTELQCKKKEKCSFYETEFQFDTRQKSFTELHGIREQTKRCSKCREFKSVTEFNAMTAAPDGLSYYCRDCDKEIMREYLSKRRGEKR